MWLLILEMILALGLMVLIVVWTFRARVERPIHSGTTHNTPAQDELKKRVD